MNQKRKKIICVVIISCICLFSVFLYQKETLFLDEKYTLYVGLNDKDTYSQIITTKEAQTILSEICLRYTDGFTIFDGNGVYKDKKGILTKEKNFICIFFDITEGEVKQISKEVMLNLNQSSVLVEHAKVKREFIEREDILYDQDRK